MCAVRCVVGGAKKTTKQSEARKKLNGKNLDNEQMKGAKTFALTQSVYLHITASTLMFEYCVTRCAKNGHFKFMGLTEAIKNVVLCIRTHTRARAKYTSSDCMFVVVC